MSRYDAIIIGGGINGLAAGAVLARQGKSVCILEKSDHLGGMAAPDAEGTPRLAHLLYNLSPLVRREIGLDSTAWPFRMIPVPTIALAPDGRHVVIEGRAARYLDGAAHPDADAYRRLMDQMADYGALLRHLAEGAPPGFDGTLLSPANLRQLWRLARFGLGLKRMEKSQMRRFLQVLLSNAFDLILDEMADGPLAGLLAADAVRGAAAGPRSPGTVFSLIYRAGHGAELTVPEGGMGRVIDAFAGAAQRAGCTIHLGADVTSIRIEADAVTGVETAAGEHLDTRLVLTSTGAMQAASLAGHAHFDIEATRRMRNIRARGTAAKINLRLQSPLPLPGAPATRGVTRLIHAPSATYVERAFTPSKYREMSPEPVIEAVVSEDGLHLSCIVQYAPVDLAGGWDEAAKTRLLRYILEALRPSLPELPDLVAEAEIITPDQIAAETGAPGGHWHHAEMALDQILTLRPANGIGRYALGPKGLYLCGASAHPGGDLMGLAGRNAARAALEAS